MEQRALDSSNMKLKLQNDDRYMRRSKKQFWSNKFTEFCNRTDLHGYKYIVMEEFSNFERTCWAVAVLLSMVVAAYFVLTAYNWFAKNPIVTVIESTQGAIWDIPFPAVTICDINIVSKKAAREFSNNITLPANVTSDSVFESLRLIPLMYSTFTASAKDKADLEQLQSILDINDISMDYLFKILSPALSCNHLLEKCVWKNKVHRCDELFKQILIMPSLCCCTFNYYAVWENEEDKIFPNLPNLQTPRRITSCGYQTGLGVLMYSDLDDYYSSTYASQGVLVIIDSAYNIPNLDSPVRVVNPSTEVLIALAPERTFTTPGIKKFTPEARQCYYNDEFRIDHIRQYSFHNCMAFQKTQLVKAKCDCVPHFVPLNDSRYCNFKDINCMETVLISVKEMKKQRFKCLPECEYYNYPMEVALGKFADSEYTSVIPFFADVTTANRSLLNVFFNNLVSTTYRRDVYLTWQNVSSAFGGLLSLMIGFTLISAFDLILFLFIRVGYDSISWFFTKEQAVNRIHVHENPKAKLSYDLKVLDKNADKNDYYHRY